MSGRESQNVEKMKRFTLTDFPSPSMYSTLFCCCDQKRFGGEYISSSCWVVLSLVLWPSLSLQSRPGRRDGFRVGNLVFFSFFFQSPVTGPPVTEDKKISVHRISNSVFHSSFKNPRKKVYPHHRENGFLRSKQFSAVFRAKQDDTQSASLAHGLAR